MLYAFSSLQYVSTLRGKRSYYPRYIWYFLYLLDIINHCLKLTVSPYVFIYIKDTIDGYINSNRFKTRPIVMNSSPSFDTQCSAIGSIFYLDVLTVRFQHI